MGVVLQGPNGNDKRHSPVGSVHNLIVKHFGQLHSISSFLSGSFPACEKARQQSVYCVEFEGLSWQIKGLVLGRTPATPD